MNQLRLASMEVPADFLAALALCLLPPRTHHLICEIFHIWHGMTDTAFLDWSEQQVHEFLAENPNLPPNWLPVCSFNYLQRHQTCDVTFVAILPADASSLAAVPINLITGRKTATLYISTPTTMSNNSLHIDNSAQPSATTEPTPVKRRKPIIHAFNAKCPHSGQPIHEPTVPCTIVDIENVPFLTCNHHGWSFDLWTGKCTSNRYVLDVFSTKVKPFRGEDWVFISRHVVNEDIAGPRKDYQNSVTSAFSSTLSLPPTNS